jgi:hypothetical protein
MHAQGAVRAAGELTPLVRLFRANWRPVTLTYQDRQLTGTIALARIGETSVLEGDPINWRAA